jgi:hypothetical protein
MAVTRQMIENALAMTLDDYLSDEDNVSSEDLIDVRKRFTSLIDTTLLPDCEDEDEDEDDEDDDEIEEEDEEK